MGRLEARELIIEAHNALIRAGRLKNDADYSGSIEAAQHCIELSLKALYLLVGLKPPYEHNPTKNLHEVLSRIALPKNWEWLIVDLARASWISSMYEFAHNASIYGYKDVPASRLFRSEDVEMAMMYSRQVEDTCSQLVSLAETDQLKLTES